MKQVCPMCADDEDVSRTPLGPGIWDYECSNPKHDQPFRWQGTDQGELDGAEGQEGLAAELGMFDELPQCVHADEGWVEYGIVEDRYSKLNPEAFATLLDRYGHRTLRPGEERRFTTSSYIAMILGRLRDRDILAAKWSKATGVWSYNGQISYWAPKGTLENAPTKTYAEYSAGKDLPS